MPTLLMTWLGATDPSGPAKRAAIKVSGSSVFSHSVLSVFAYPSPSLFPAASRASARFVLQVVDQVMNKFKFQTPMKYLGKLYVDRYVLCPFLSFPPCFDPKLFSNSHLCLWGCLPGRSMPI